MSNLATVTPMPVRIPTWSFGDRLRKVRREIVGVSMADMAARLEVGDKAYAAWETGRNTPQNIAALAVRLERLTGVPRTWFLGWEDDAAAAQNAPSAMEGGEGWAHRDSNPGPAD